MPRPPKESRQRPPFRLRCVGRGAVRPRGRKKSVRGVGHGFGPQRQATVAIWRTAGPPLGFGTSCSDCLPTQSDDGKCGRARASSAVRRFGFAPDGGMRSSPQCAKPDPAYVSAIWKNGKQTELRPEDPSPCSRAFSERSLNPSDHALLTSTSAGRRHRKDRGATEYRAARPVDPFFGYAARTRTRVAPRAGARRQALGARHA